jgi:hypothetical protein
MRGPVMRTLGDGSMIEVGLVGFEGFVGVHSLAPTAEQPYRLIVQNSGATYRLPLKRFAASLLCVPDADQSDGGLQSTPQDRERLARWLLMMRDRVTSDELNLTQEFLSHMLGTRLAGVNDAIRALTMDGLVKHRRNLITILDRVGLEAAACSHESAEMMS